MTRHQLSSKASDRALVAFPPLRGAERTARAVLEAGCRAELERLECFIEPPLRRARLEMAACLTSLGALDPILSANLKREQAENVVARCAYAVFANASVRFRARFLTYAEDLAAAQRHFAEAVLGAQCAPPKVRRRIAPPRIELDDERSVMPEWEPSLSEIDEWTAELARRLRATLQSVVVTACAKTLALGAAALARTSVAVRLAARSQPRSTPAVAPKIRSYRSLP